MSETPMSEERISDLEMRRSVGRITSDDGSELLREVRRQSEPQARPGVDALLRPFEDMLRLLARSDSTSPEADAEFEHAISRVRAALTAPSPFDALELWLREDWRRTISWGGASEGGECQIVLQTGRKTYSGVGPALSEAVAQALKKAEGK